MKKAGKKPKTEGWIDSIANKLNGKSDLEKINDRRKKLGYDPVNSLPGLEHSRSNEHWIDNIPTYLFDKIAKETNNADFTGTGFFSKPSQVLDKLKLYLKDHTTGPTDSINASNFARNWVDDNFTMGMFSTYSKSERSSIIDSIFNFANSLNRWKETYQKQGVAEGYQLDEGAVETITALAKKIPGIGKYYQMAQQYKPQLIEILKTSKSGKEVKQKMEQLAAGQSATVAESGMMKQLGGLAVGGGSILSTMWMNAMGMIDGVLAHAAAGEVGGAVASGSILGLIPVTLMLFAAMLMFKGSNQSSDEKAQAFQAQRGQKGVAEGQGHPADDDMGTTTGGTKMSLGQWKQMWMKKMPNADFAALFRSPPNMQGSAIAYFDGWMNNPDARWDPVKGVAEDTELAEEFDLIESIVEMIAEHNGVDAEVVWADLESLTEDELYVFAVTSDPLMEDWQKANKRDKTDGMSQKAVNAYRRENPGSKLKTAVTTKPSKLKKGGKASKRRKSYCSRSRGQMKMHSISCAKTPDKAICKARRRWNC
jgi:hypothetical protein